MVAQEFICSAKSFCIYFLSPTETVLMLVTYHRNFCSHHGHHHCRGKNWRYDGFPLLKPGRAMLPSLSVFLQWFTTEEKSAPIDSWVKDGGPNVHESFQIETERQIRILGLRLKRALWMQLKPERSSGEQPPCSLFRLASIEANCRSTRVDERTLSFHYEWGPLWSPTLISLTLIPVV